MNKKGIQQVIMEAILLVIAGVIVIVMVGFGAKFLGLQFFSDEEAASIASFTTIVSDINDMNLKSGDDVSLVRSVYLKEKWYIVSFPIKRFGTRPGDLVQPQVYSIYKGIVDGTANPITHIKSTQGLIKPLVCGDLPCLCLYKKLDLVKPSDKSIVQCTTFVSEIKQVYLAPSENEINLFMSADHYGGNNFLNYFVYKEGGDIRIVWYYPEDRAEYELFYPTLRNRVLAPSSISFSTLGVLPDLSNYADWDNFVANPREPEKVPDAIILLNTFYLENNMVAKAQTGLQTLITNKNNILYKDKKAQVLKAYIILSILNNDPTLVDEGLAFFDTIKTSGLMDNEIKKYAAYLYYQKAIIDLKNGIAPAATVKLSESNMFIQSSTSEILIPYIDLFQTIAEYKQHSASGTPMFSKRLHYLIDGLDPLGKGAMACYYKSKVTPEIDDIKYINTYCKDSYLMNLGISYKWDATNIVGNIDSLDACLTNIPIFRNNEFSMGSYFVTNCNGIAP